MKEAWYKNGLKFECKKCGNCCTFPGGYVWLDIDEIIVISKKMNLTMDEFGQKYLRNVEGDYSLIEKFNGECIMYENDGCKIYDFRPIQCRAFPFWPENLTSKQDWGKVKKMCKGINCGKEYTFSEIKNVLDKQEK